METSQKILGLQEYLKLPSLPTPLAYPHPFGKGLASNEKIKI